MTLAVMVYSGGHFFRGAWQQLKHRNSNMDTLISLGTGTAWLYSMLVVLFPTAVPSLARHAYFEAALVIIALVSFGNALEMRARGRTSAAIKSLMKLQPPIAHVIRNGQELDLPLEDVGLEETLRVRAGETVPLDGKVLQGAIACGRSPCSPGNRSRLPRTRVIRSRVERSTVRAVS